MATQGTGLNMLSCLTNAKNTGYGSCTIDMKRIIACIAIPKGKTFSSSDIGTGGTTWQTTISGLTSADTPITRCYTLGRWIGVKKNTQSAQEYTIPYIGKVTLQPAVPIVGFQWLNGGICEYLNILQFHATHSQYDYIFVDANQTCWGRWLFASDGVTKVFGGFTMSDVAVDTVDIPDQSNPILMYINFAMDNADQFRQYLAYISCGFDVIAQTPGFQTAQVSGATQGGSTHGVYNMTAAFGCTNQDLFLYYSAALAVTGVWKAYNSATGLAIAISTVTQNVDGWQVTINVSDANYPTVGQALTLNLALPSVLKSVASVTGIEGGTPVTLLAT